MPMAAADRPRIYALGGSSDELNPITGVVASSAGSTVRGWRKVLYERQAYEDNYVDPEQFMQDLKQNVNLKTYEYGKVVMDTFAILQQISFVVFFLYAFAMIHSGQMKTYALFWIDATLFALLFLFYVQLQHQQALGCGETPTPLPQHLGVLSRQVFPLVMMFLLLSPVLQTLTVTYSDDTIVALSTFAMCLNILFSDYNYLNCYSKKCQQSMSVNAATFGTILVASRIQSLFHNAALITFGILCFTLSPIPRHHLKRSSLTAHVGLTFALCGLAAGCLMQVPLFAVFYCLLVMAVSVVIPWCFVTLHGSMKNQINGPWDEAKPTNSAAAAEWSNAGLLQ